ncbi:MAG: protoheme IX farnesyltransferase 2 [Oligoflexia bacterium]|nr:MAG: protoheme IX farnesyltransferase 2 [Oligoflexia bacterium]
MFRTYADLTKFGIVVFVILCGLAGYVVSFPLDQTLQFNHILMLVGGLFFLSSGSLSLNQVQEWETDQKMPRTARRPIASGKIKPAAAGIMSVVFLVVGSDLLFRTSILAGVFGWLTVILYNGFYTYWWKRKMIYGAVPGALPGALPVTIGYVANREDFFSAPSVWMFLVMFLWQMPHFWALAIRFREDYAKADIPTLPVVRGVEKTIQQMAHYTLAYVAVALTAPLVFNLSYVYLILLVPVSFKLLQELYIFTKSKGEQRWLAFFLWINTSILIYLFVPVIGKWMALFVTSQP